jgi:hypothetical protein
MVEESTTQLDQLRGLEAAHAERLRIVIEDLRLAVARGDEAMAARLSVETMSTDSIGVRPLMSMDDVTVRRSMHEAVDECFRKLLFNEGARSDFWRKMLLPMDLGALAHGNLICNGMWLRRTGSDIPDTNSEVLEPLVLATLDLEAQARMLGRFMVANDGAASVDYAVIAEILKPDLLPAWTEWVVSCHGQSPDALAREDIRENQERALRGLLDYWKNKPMDLAGSPVALATQYERPYRTPGSTLPVAEKVVGEWLAKMHWNMGPAETAGLQNYPEFGSLRDTETLVFCPNWRERHVIHRCLSPLLEPLRERAGTRVLMLHDPGHVQLGECADAWKSRSLELEMRTKGHYLYNIGVAAAELRTCNIDLMFFPEMCPGDATAWMGMERVARVQATGYGMPNTSGSKEMDYFLGGADIEGDGTDYCEQLVVIPGWGQALVEPPEPPLPRQRPEIDDRVQMATIATHQKLNGELLSAWNEIQRGEKNVSLELFPSLRDLNAQMLAPRLAKHFDCGSVELNGWTPREELMDTLVQSDFYLDTSPYGGYNCLIEAIACGLPIVTIEGQRARNRTAAVLLRRLGMPEFLIARDYPGYVAAAKRLINDGGLRRELRSRLSNREAVLAALHDPDAPAHYAAALDWMRKEGPRNGKRAGAPVLIRAGEAPKRLA